MPHRTCDGPTPERVDERADDRADYGELRLIAVGLADGIHLTFAYTDRPGTRDTIRRIISERRSNRRERKPMTKPTSKKSSRGRAKLEQLRRVSDAEIARTSPPELAELPADFWESATLTVPTPKRAISLRVDEDVLEWFRTSGPRYQTRMNAVLRSYVAEMRRRRWSGRP